MITRKILTSGFSFGLSIDCDSKSAFALTTQQAMNTRDQVKR